MQQQNKKSKFRKWLYRVAFILLILLMLLQLHHYDMALDAIAKLNVEQNHTIDSLQKELHNIDLHNQVIEHKVDGLQLKINGQYQDIHSENIPQPDIHKKVHTVSAFTPTSVITTTTVTVLTILKGITSLIPAFN